MASGFDSEETTLYLSPALEARALAKNGKLPGGQVRMEVQALGLKGAAAYAAQEERAHKKTDTSTD